MSGVEEVDVTRVAGSGGVLREQDKGGQREDSHGSQGREGDEPCKARAGEADSYTNSLFPGNFVALGGD